MNSIKKVEFGSAWQPKPLRRQGLAIAKNGSVWHWNNGWYVMERKKHSKTYTPKASQASPLGHARFRSAVQLLIKSNREERQVLLGVEKPGQPWRRIVDGGLYEHFLYGNVRILATDGMHAVVEETDGMVLTVMFDNLTEQKPMPELKRTKEKTVEKKEKTSKEEGKKKSMELLQKLMDMSA
tara:strand:+ start:5751 stop:6296 length:546 start_codon:yes stop_codon:yes gene_type:complete